ncbi:hemerythrin domain-containing protein [Pseudonocardia lacus]|uniref:hemerythrin domain-containing protein n=1 Tax=Pseudonocardia lacus TaxID=2835865 RepID=UPI001BDD63C5|nr:hemerythrin domain-containing protein [Pseudonocardia lacus]
MADITDVILDEHEWFRRQFAALDRLQGQDPLDVEAVRAVWQPLADHLDVHAIAEERIFYPQLLRFGDDPQDETLDAIGDHNDIRDGVHEAGRYPVGTAEWWAAVGRARAANDEHMGEEEREGLSDFRQHAPSGLREALGVQFTEFLAAHRTTAGLDTSDKDPQGYVRAVEREIGSDPSDGSLGIGSLRGR